MRITSGLIAAAAASVFSASAPAAVVITEIFYNLNGTEGGNTEWIEIYNTGSATVDLSGWEYGDSQDNTWGGNFAAGTLLGAGEAAVIVKQDAATFQSVWGAGVKVINYPSPDFVDGISLGNTGSSTNETVAIRDASDVIVDEVNYETGTNGWPTGTNANGKTIYLLPDYVLAGANDVGSHWSASVAGTDGAYAALILNPGITNATASDIASPGVVAIPEPASLSLLALGSLALGRRRR